MKIGVLTYHCVPNFGAQLQAMSTVGYLKRMGHTPVVLHWYPKDLEQLYSRRISSRQIACHWKFAEDCFPLTSLCRNEKQLVREIERHQLDMIVTGSDALFRYVPQSDRRREFSKRRLRFVDNFSSCEDLDGNPFFCDYYGELSRQIPVVAFSVSSQSCPFFRMKENEREKMGQYLRNFKKITVRDQWTKRMVEEISGLQDVDVTPDPVFAFNQNCYINIPSKDELSTRFSLPDHYALFSFTKGMLPSDYLQDLGTLFQTMGIAPFALAEPEGNRNDFFPNQIQLPLSPIEWYALIKGADVFIGSRMHPIIVCLHNSIPFYSYDSNGVVDSVTGEFSHNSSKTFDILDKADFRDHVCCLKANDPVPSARDLFSVVSSFDKQKCYNFSQTMLQKYQFAMSSILNS